jgi:hypothetical protein
MSLGLTIMTRAIPIHADVVRRKIRADNLSPQSDQTLLSNIASIKPLVDAFWPLVYEQRLPQSCSVASQYRLKRQTDPENHFEYHDRWSELARLNVRMFHQLNIAVPEVAGSVASVFDPTVVLPSRFRQQGLSARCSKIFHLQLTNR